MKMINHIFKFCILHCSNPFQKKSMLSFQKIVCQARRILIITPFDYTPVFDQTLINAMMKLFPDHICTFLSTHELDMASVDTRYKWMVIENEYLSLWRFSRSSIKEQLAQTHIDLLIDLDPEFNLISAYLFRTLKTGLRISFEKEGSEHLSNFQFNTSGNTPYTDHVKKVISVLKTFLK